MLDLGMLAAFWTFLLTLKVRSLNLNLKDNALQKSGIVSSNRCIDKSYN